MFAFHAGQNQPPQAKPCATEARDTQNRLLVSELHKNKKGGLVMNVDRYLRLIAGAFVVLSLALGYWVSPYWYLFTAFVGLNLFQSAFTNWCPMMAILRKAGIKA
jgi:hypothetical protein